MLSVRYSSVEESCLFPTLAVAEPSAAFWRVLGGAEDRAGNNRGVALAHPFGFCRFSSVRRKR
jgi:hypothetical protein